MGAVTGGPDDPLAGFADRLAPAALDRPPAVPLPARNTEYLARDPNTPGRYGDLIFVRTSPIRDPKEFAAALELWELAHDALQLRFGYEGRSWRAWTGA